jgi:hypothetical protein
MYDDEGKKVEKEKQIDLPSGVVGETSKRKKIVANLNLNNVLLASRIDDSSLQIKSLRKLLARLYLFDGCIETIFKSSSSRSWRRRKLFIGNSSSKRKLFTQKDFSPFFRRGELFVEKKFFPLKQKESSKNEKKMFRMEKR